MWRPALRGLWRTKMGRSGLGFNQLYPFGEIQPTVSPLGPIKFLGFGEFWISEASNRDTDDLRPSFHAITHLHTTRRAEIGLNPASGIDLSPPGLSLTSNRHCRFWIDGTIRKGSATFSLAVEAAASINLQGFCTRRDRQIATATSGRTLERDVCLCHLSAPHVVIPRQLCTT